MDWPPGLEEIPREDWPFEVENSWSLRDPSRKTEVDELRDYVKGTSAGLPAAILVRLARSGMEDEVFAAFPRLAEADPRVMSLACEYLQVHLFDRKLNRSSYEWPGVRREQKLNFFRLAQRMRDEHGTTRETSSPNCFQSSEDIVELERNIKIDNCSKFMIQCLRLDLVDGRHVEDMFRSTSTVEQLVALYDESVSMLERWKRYPDEKKQPHSNYDRYNLGVGFMFQFRNLMSTRPCERPLWQDIKMYVERAAYLDASDGFTSTVEIPDADLDEALSCLLSNAELFTRIETSNELAELSKSLLIRGASLFHWDQHGVSSLRRLLALGDKHVKWSLQTLSTYICCPLRNERGKIVADNRRPAALSCLAAGRIPLSTIEEQLPSQLRPFVRGHWELRGVLTGSIQNPEPVKKWRRHRRCISWRRWIV